jgi:uncharacterized protein YgbK (DUF1537 family)
VAGPWLRVIADDLTGACDVAAALLPHPGRIVVESIERDPGADDGVLTVRNTQSRTLAPEAAAARVRRAVADVPRAPHGRLFKKIDTALRGPLGAELDAAMDAVRAGLALVLPAIPEVGRVTRGGRQLIDGVPVDRTAFARDPQNPVDDASVAGAIARTSERRVATLGLDELRRVGARAAIAEARIAGATVVVGDAETDADLRAWVAGIAHETDAPVVLVGSTGLARAWRGAAVVPAATSALASHGSVLVVAGSAHPTTRSQLEHAVDQGLLGSVVLDVDDPPASASEVARRLANGGHAALVVPQGAVDGGSTRVLGAIADAVAAALERVRPGALLLVGGETAFHVLAGLGHPRLAIEAVPAPLCVRATILDGVLAGLPVVTKGGSSGPRERLAELIRGGRA